VWRRRTPRGAAARDGPLTPVSLARWWGVLDGQAGRCSTSRSRRRTEHSLGIEPLDDGAAPANRASERKRLGRAHGQVARPAPDRSKAVATVVLTSEPQ